VAYEHALIHWMLDCDAPSQEAERMALVTRMREIARDPRDRQPPLTAMLTTAHAVRHATTVAGLARMSGPLAARAWFTTVDDSAPQKRRVEFWEVDTPPSAPS